MARSASPGAETYARCRRLASALARLGIGKNDTVSVMLPNTPPMVEVHFGVPMCGAVLNSLNTRLDAETIAFMLRHAEAKVLITDREFSPVVGMALAHAEVKPLVIDVDDPSYTGGHLLGTMEYEAFLETGDPDHAWQNPADEWDAISLIYTSGTTGDPKGVVYHHRGAHLNAISNILNWDMPQHAVYLWTLPMFHCNGWCFPGPSPNAPGSMFACAGSRPRPRWTRSANTSVTHMCGAPIVYSMLINAPADLLCRPCRTRSKARSPAPRRPPRSSKAPEQIGIDLTHVYGLTEIYGPAAVCSKQDEWAAHADRPPRRTQWPPGRADAVARSDDRAGP